MILTEFDYEKNAIINPWHTSDMVQGMPKVAVTCFSRVTFARMLSAFGGERIASTNVANMEIPVYKTVYHGYEICLCPMLEHLLVWEQWRKSMQWVWKRLSCLELVGYSINQ